MKALGNYIILKNLAYKETSIELSEEAKASMELDNVESLKRLPVLFKGDTVTEIEVGDEVYIDTMRLINAPREIIDGEAILMLRASDVIFIY